MEEEVLYRPHKTFETTLKNQYHQEAERFFQELVDKAETDAGANKLHVKAYREQLEKVDKAKKKLSTAKGLRILSIVLMILLFIAGIALIVAFAMNSGVIALLIIGIVSIVLGGLCIWGIVAFSKKVKNRASVLAELEEEATKRRALCDADMATLNSLFDWNMPATIMENATPIIDLDPYFSNQTLEYLVSTYGFPKGENENTSVLGVISGRIQGNPFILEKVLSKEIRNKTYTGSITISWTETIGSGKNRQTVTRTQTLTASVEHPAPFYSYDTRLIYGNNAAPNLHFSRRPFGADKMSEKEREKQIKSGTKKLEKLSEKAVKKGQEFTKMSNDEFEIFWGATDRDHETEFRLLFTPLAQKSILELIESPEPYGDDFVFVKDGMINSVASSHSQNFNYNVDPSYFADYSLEDCKKRFLAYSDDFIRGLYFDLAPILCIPLYQLHKASNYIYKDLLEGNYNSYECESIANGFGDDGFRPKNADPSLPLILKQTDVSRIGKTDRVVIKAHSFHTEPRVDYVSRMGGDGRMHSVPVHWVEYTAVDQDSVIEVKKVNASQNDYRAALGSWLSEFLGRYGDRSYFQKGFVAVKKEKGKAEMSPQDDAKLEDMFTQS